MSQQTLLRRAKVEARTGLAPSTMYYFISKGDFPKPVKLGARSVAWYEHEIEEWISSREVAF